MKKQKLKLTLNKVKVSKINNLNAILGGGTDDPTEHSNAETCDPLKTCNFDCEGHTTDTTDGEATGINNGSRTTN